MQKFILKAPYQPTGDQPQAISEIVESIQKGNKYQTLHGVTGSGKTFTVANIIRELQRPVLIMAHNKTLAAQLTSEFKDFFPENAVEFFISYYDYYQPEAYLPTTDTYIEKDSSINEEIEKLRHKATFSLFNRKDVMVVSSVSCIYGLGSPEYYTQGSIKLTVGKAINREELISKLVGIRYERNDINLTRGKFLVKGEVLEIFPVYEDYILRLEFFGDIIEKIVFIDPLERIVKMHFEEFLIYPASHFVVPEVSQKEVIEEIKHDLQLRLIELRAENKLVEAQRLEQRTMYDLEMIEEMGYCTGIENYSRYLTKRNPGEPPFTLLDYFPPNLLVIVDESHATIPQIRGMFAGDRSRKLTLIEHGFRLPSALDNRPLNFEEYEAHIPQFLFISATPGPYEKSKSAVVAEQVIRPTGLLDPEIEVRKITGQMEDLLKEIKQRIEKKHRVLVITLTKKMSEELTIYLLNKKIKTKYLHSDVDTLDRYQILHDLRAGEFDVLVGINLLREGLDLPEVSLIAILDADKEGFLRDERSLIQIMGRAARNIEGKVILYADRYTGSMERAISETNRRRQIQKAYNQAHNITPTTIFSKIKDNIRDKTTDGKDNPKQKQSLKKELEWIRNINKDSLTPKDFLTTIKVLRTEMKTAAEELDFEKAAILRDKIYELQNTDKI